MRNKGQLNRQMRSDNWAWDCFGGLIAAMLCVGIAGCSQNDEAPRASSDQGIVREVIFGKKDPSQRAATKEGVGNDILHVTLEPRHPTVLDAIMATVQLPGGSQSGVTVEYVWRINGKTVPNENANILPAGVAKKRDQVSVVVNSVLDGAKGAALESNFLQVQSAPPVLELKTISQKVEAVIELQVTARDPDGDKVSFALEAPVPDGMTINADSGKISWSPPKREPGTYKVNVSGTDTDGARTITTFSFAIGGK